MKGEFSAVTPLCMNELYLYGVFTEALVKSHFWSHRCLLFLLN